MGCELLIYLKGVSIGLYVVILLVAGFLFLMLISSELDWTEKKDRKVITKIFFVIVACVLVFILLPSVGWWDAMIAKYQAAPL